MTCNSDDADGTGNGEDAKARASKRFKRTKPRPVRSKEITKGERLKKSDWKQPENNFYEKVMEDMEEAGQSQIVEFLTKLKEKEDEKTQKEMEKERKEKEKKGVAKTTQSKPIKQEVASAEQKTITTQKEPSLAKKSPFMKQPVTLSDQYRQKFVDNGESYSATTANFKTIPRQELEQLMNKEAHSRPNISGGLYTPKYHNVHPRITQTCKFSESQRDRRTLYFRGGPAELVNTQMESQMFKQQVANRQNFEMTSWQQEKLQTMQPFQGQFHTFKSSKKNWKTGTVGGNGQSSTENLQKLIQKEFNTPFGGKICNKGDMQNCFSSRANIKGKIIKEIKRQASTAPIATEGRSSKFTQNSSDRNDASRQNLSSVFGRSSKNSASMRRQFRNQRRELNQVTLTENATTGIQVPDTVKEQLYCEEKFKQYPGEGELVDTTKQRKMFSMDKMQERHTIFECMAGANEKQFEHNHHNLSTVNSKYKRQDRCTVEFGSCLGREKETELNPEPEEFSPDYNPNKDRFKKNLRLGAVSFDGMSGRKPNLNKTYDKTQTYYHQRQQPILNTKSYPNSARKTQRVTDKFSMGSTFLDPQRKALSSTLNGRMFSHLTKEDAGFQEKLAHRRRTNVSFTNFDRTRGRDDSMYYISDGFNLKKGAKPSEFDRFLQMKLQQKLHDYHAIKKTQEIIQKKKQEHRNAREAEKSEVPMSRVGSDSDEDATSKRTKQVMSQEEDEVYDPSKEHDISADGLRKYNKVIARIDRLTAATASSRLTQTKAFTSNLSLEQRILDQQFKMSDTQERFRKEVLSRKEVQDEAINAAIINRGRAAVVTAEAGNPRKQNLISPNTTAARTTQVPQTAGFDAGTDGVGHTHPPASPWQGTQDTE